MQAMKNLLIRCFLSCADLNEEAMKAGGGDENQYKRQMSLQSKEKIREFFEEVELVKKEIASIRNLLALIKAADEECMLLTRQDVARAARHRIRMDRHNLQIVKISLRIRGCLEDMDRSNAANRRLPCCSGRTAVDPIRTVQTNMLRWKFKELMMDFLRVRQRIMADLMMEVRHRYFPATGEVTSDEEVLEKMFFEGTSEEILRTAIYSSGRREVIEALSEIQNRHEALKDMVNSMHKFYRMIFLDSVVLVDSEDDEMMNDIEYHILNAASCNKGGTKELNSA